MFITVIIIIPICEFVNRFISHFGIKGDFMIIQRIISLLEEKSLTATDLCRSIGINTSTMTNWKNRGTDPPAKMIIPICEFLGVSSNYLLTGNEESQKETLSQEDLQWLLLIHQLPRDAQLEFKGELKGYLKCLERQSVAADQPIRKAK